MNNTEHLYDLISVLFVLWISPVLIGITLLLLGGPVLGIFFFTLLGMVLIAVLLAIALPQPAPHTPIKNVYQILGEIIPDIPFLTLESVILISIVFGVLPLLLTMVLSEKKNESLTVQTYDWTQLSLYNIKEAIYHSVTFGISPSKTALTLETKNVAINFKSREDFEQHIKDIEQDEETCNLCNHHPQNQISTKYELDHMCDDCLEKIIIQLSDDEIQIKESVLASRI